MKHDIVINIGDTDENADWIKTKKNRREEREIHEELEREYQEREEAEE
jgi:hypothetical protein